jgi:hypothetical protein
MGIAKHLMKDGLTELVKAVDGALTLTAELIRLIEDRCYPPLLVKRRKWDFYPLYNCLRHFLECCAVAQKFELSTMAF